jgi:hypothetical protein
MMIVLAYTAGDSWLARYPMSGFLHYFYGNVSGDNATQVVYYEEQAANHDYRAPAARAFAPESYLYRISAGPERCTQGVAILHRKTRDCHAAETENHRSQRVY